MWYHSIRGSGMSERSVLSGYIRRRMRELGIGHQAELARRAGISTGGLSYILNAESVLSKPDTIDRLAKALEVEPAELTSRMGYDVDASTPDAMTVRLARAIEARPWLADRKDQLLSLSEEEFHELMDLAEFRRNRGRDRQDPDSQ